MDDPLGQAVRLFNQGHFSEFQDALEALTSHTRASSERQFYSLLDNLAEAMLQLGDGDVLDAEQMIADALRKLDDFVPRFRGLNVEALRDDFRRVLVELRDAREGRRPEPAPSRLPRLRVVAD
jgi:ABC-type transporter Mla subunit MlaD